MVLWVLGLFGIMVSIPAHVYLYTSIVQLEEGTFRRSMTGLFTASFLYLTFSALTVTYGFIGVDIANTAWTAVPGLMLLAVAAWAYSMLTLFMLVEER